MSRIHLHASWLLIALLAAAAAHAQNPTSAPPPPTRQPPVSVVDVVAMDRDGRFVEDLRPADFAVSVDGTTRRVLWVRRVSRGPAAMSDAATRLAAADADVMFGAEGERTVFVVIDEASIARGDERAAIQAAGVFLDRLGLDDPVAVLRLPLQADTKVTVSTERAEIRLALSKVSGQRSPGAEALPIAAPEPVSADPDRMSGLEPDKPVRPDARAEAAPHVAGDSARALGAIFETLRPLPGRKVVAVFSAGLSSEAGRTVEEAALTAASARATVYAFGLRSSLSDSVGLATGPLERLAAATGGAYVSVGKNPDRVIERLVRELSACYVLGVDAPAASARPSRRVLKIELAKKGLALRAPAWLVPLEDTADRAVTLGAVPTVDLAPAPPPSSLAPTAPVRAPRKDDPELNLALARLFAYSEAYERQYSMLVSEEDYRQRAPKGSVHLRSDFLLVRPSPNEDWVSFRDVFEVDGQPVRDREERLRRLFLEGTPEARARMDAIRDEGARYNIGIVGRTVNVPLLPLVFLRRENRGRFEYHLDGRSEAAGVEVLKIRYSEWARPTLVSDGRMGDQPVSGWFLIDAITGAVVESRMEAKRDEARAELVVRYRRDETLGLWVPAEMNELYSVPEMTGVGRGIQRSTLEGRATYSNFRRFQVQTDEKITTPK